MKERGLNFFKRILIFSIGFIPILYIVSALQGVTFFFGYALVVVPIAAILHPFQTCTEVCVGETMHIITLIVGFVYALFVFNYFSWRSDSYANIVKNSLEFLLVFLFILIPAVYITYTNLRDEYDKAVFSPPQLTSFEEERNKAIEWNQKQIALDERLLEANKAYDAGAISEEELQKAYNEILGGGKFKIGIGGDTATRIAAIEASLESKRTYAPLDAEQEYELSLANYSNIRRQYESRGVPTIIDALQAIFFLRGW